MSEFKREERFIVIKRKHLSAESRTCDSLEQELRIWLDRHLVPTSECVVVESDWPEYETVWAMLAARIEGRPTPYQVLEQKVAALRQHKNDYMEAAEGTRRALVAEAKALREEVAAASEREGILEHRLMRVMTQHFAEAWRKRDTDKTLEGYLSAGIAALERERDAALEQVAALRARVVVPERAVRNPHSGKTQAYVVTEHWNEGWNACLDELARLNGKAVSEGLLRSAYTSITELILSAQTRPSCQKGMVDPCRCHRCNVERALKVDAELRALLGDGKEVGDVLVRE